LAIISFSSSDQDSIGSRFWFYRIHEKSSSRKSNLKNHLKERILKKLFQRASFSLETLPLQYMQKLVLTNLINTTCCADFNSPHNNIFLLLKTSHLPFYAYLIYCLNMLCNLAQLHCKIIQQIFLKLVFPILNTRALPQNLLFKHYLLLKCRKTQRNKFLQRIAQISSSVV
jgi:hypothetical protein